MSFSFSVNIFFFLFNNIDDFLVLSCNFVFKFIACLSKLGDISLHLIFLLFGHEGFSHSVCNWTFVQSLISLDSHLYFISDSNKKESSLGTVDGNLSNQLIKALRVKLFSNWADTSVSGLSWLKFMVQVILEIDNVHSSSWGWRNIFNPKRSFLSVFSRWKNRVQVIFISCSSCLLKRS